MKLFRETHDEDADLAVIQYGGGTIATVESIEITGGEIENVLTKYEEECGGMLPKKHQNGVSEHELLHCRMCWSNSQTHHIL